jgi:hypothetical protein
MILLLLHHPCVLSCLFDACRATQEFSAAIAAITAALLGPSAHAIAPSKHALVANVGVVCVQVVHWLHCHAVAASHMLQQTAQVLLADHTPAKSSKEKMDADWMQKACLPTQLLQLHFTRTIKIHRVLYRLRKYKGCARI